jgi:chromosome segregation ATPase
MNGSQIDAVHRALAEKDAEIERLQAENQEAWNKLELSEERERKLRAAIAASCDEQRYELYPCGRAAEAETEIERLRAALHNLQGCDIDNAAQDIIIRALEPKP